MGVSLYMDVHIPQAITDQLRRKGVDVLTALEDGCEVTPDAELLDRAGMRGRLIFTQDIRFKARAEQMQRAGWAFAGPLFAHPWHATIGELVQDLELIAKASEPGEWMNIVEHLPFRRPPGDAGGK